MFPNLRDDVIDILVAHEWMSSPIEAAVHHPVGSGEHAGDSMPVVLQRRLPREVSADHRPGLDAVALEMVAQTVTFALGTAQHRVSEWCGRATLIEPHGCNEALGAQRG